MHSSYTTGRRRGIAFVFFLASVLSIAVPAKVRADEPVDWDTLIAQSYEYLYAVQDTLESEFELSKQERWDVDQDTGLLTFSNAGVPSVEASIVFVGSYSTSAGSWLWSWANDSIDKNLSDPVQPVRDFGSKHGFEKLTDEGWEAEEVDGWEMAAISAYILKGKGVYRPPYSSGVAFLVLTDVRHVGKD